MKYLKPILIVILLLIGLSTYAQTTTIWLARHAEKEANAGSNPDLSAAGKHRALELVAQLKKQTISAVFSTQYKRTQQTAQPTLKENGTAVMVIYDPSDLAKLAAMLKKDHAGKSVLVIGHSNTIVPTLEALGVEKPFDTLSDDDYDMLFKVTIGAEGKAKLAIKHYGAKAHTTAIPEKYSLTE